MSSSQHDHETCAVLKIIIIYALFGGMWIYFSDTVLGWLVHDPVLMTYVAISKGLLFIMVTASLLYILIKRYARRSLRINRILRERDELLRSIASNTPGVIYQFYFTDDGSSGFSYVSDRITEIFGLSADTEHLFSAFTAQVMEPDRDRLLESIQKAVAARAPWRFEGRFVKPTGEVVWFHGRSSPQSEKDRVVYNGVLLDITDQKRMEEALVESEDRFKFLVSTSQEWIWAIDTEGRHTYSNAAIQNILGYHPDEMLGPIFSHFLYAQDIPKAAEILSQCIEDKTGWTNLVLRWKHRDGTIRYLESNSVPIFGNNGYLQGFHGSDRDITDRMRAEDELRKSEARYRSIFENATRGIYQTTFDDRLMRVNPALAHMHGYASPDDMIQHLPTIKALAVHSKDRPLFLRRLNAEGVINSYEMELYKKDGNTFWASLNTWVVRDADGIPLYYEGIVEDITERKRTEEALRESEARYRKIFEDAIEGIYQTTPAGKYLSVNPAFARMFGYASPQEMMVTVTNIGQQLYVNPKDREEMVRLLREYDRVEGYEVEVYRKDRSRFWISINIHTVRDATGGMLYFEGTNVDITERKKAEAALKKSEERYRILAENARDIIWGLDLNLQYTYVSPSVTQVLGYTVEEALNMRLNQILTPESFKSAREIISKGISPLLNGQDHDPAWSYTEEQEMIRKDGSTIWTEVTVSILSDENDKPKGIMGITRDITERKNAEEELTQAQKMKSIGTLAGGIAHDFNNLLTGILGNVSLVLLKMDDTNPFYERLKKIESYVQRGSDLTKQLLGFARGGKYEVKPTDLGAFTRFSSEMFGRTKKEIHMHHKAQEDLWAVEADRGQMEQVFLNLFVNAWQAMPGGGDLYLSVENVELGLMDVSPYDIKPGKFVKVTVSDTGIGMDEATQKQIFEPFFTTKERGHGTGLGLASVYGIIKNHGGFIQVESEKGVGTSFMIHLPASTRTVEEEHRHTDEAQMGQGTILLIDDEEMILDIGSKMLEGLGYTVITATGGWQGLQLYAKDKDKINLVILDMIMPDFSGKDTFDALLRINQSVRVLLASGYSLDSQAEGIMQSGCKGFIQKPFTIVELSKKIHGILEER